MKKVTKKLVKVGEYRLSDKGIRQAGKQWKEYLGGVSPENIRMIVFDSGKAFKHVFYVSNETRKTCGPPEYRKIDSYFTPVKLGFKPIMDRQDFVHSAQDLLMTTDDFKSQVAAHFIIKLQ